MLKNAEKRAKTCKKCEKRGKLRKNAEKRGKTSKCKYFERKRKNIMKGSKR